MSLILHLKGQCSVGFFDKISEKAREAAENARKAASQAIENASKTAMDLSEKASAEFAEISDKASKEFVGFSQKASAEGSHLFGKVSEGFSSLSDTVGTSAKELTAWAEGMPDKLRKMADDFDADAMWDKLSKTAAKAGQDLIVMVLTIYYSVESRITNSESNGKSK